MKQILILEDEDAIREFIVINLQRAGYTTVEAHTGDEALALYQRDPDAFDLAVLDIMVPGPDGLAVCQEIRKSSATIGIIMLTARTQETDKVNGLKLGADDYITKPFSPSELVARVEALYRRVESQMAGAQRRGKLRSGEFTLDLRNRELFRGERKIELTQLEFLMMEYFFRNAGAQLTRSNILQRVWGESYLGEEKIVDVNVRRLRMKIEDDPSQPKHILTVWGHGYKWQE